MEPTPIETLLSSWETSELGATIYDPQTHIEGPSLFTWPLRRIKRHFESRNPDHKIACPCLAPSRLSVFALETNRQSGNGEQLKRLVAQDPYFMGRSVLGQESVILRDIRCRFTTYIEVEQGKVLVLSSNNSDGSQMANRSSQSTSGQMIPMFLSAGFKTILPPGSTFCLFFQEDTLLTTGCIVPPLHGPRAIARGLCNVCQDIPFDKLNREEGPGHAHQESIQHILASSERCELCELILEAIIEIEKEHARFNYPIKPELIENSSKLKEAQVNVLGATDDSGEGRFFTRQQLSKGKDFLVGTVAWRSPLAHKFVETQEDPENDPDASFSALIPSKYDSKPWIYGNYWTLNGIENCQPQLIGLGVRLSRGPELEVMNGSQKIARYLFRGSQIRILAPADTPRNMPIPGRLLHQRYDQEVPAMKLITKFLVSCFLTHNDSCVLPETDLPTRVLDLSEIRTHKHVKLLSTGNIRGRYIALSHCWGSSHPLRTTLETFLQHQQGIPVRLLPLTFQHAARICHELGIQYLWIDSLCIIQDDPRDWEIEADKMSEVYANAWLTVAASSSTGSASGCYTCKQPPAVYISYESQSTGMNEVRVPSVQLPFPIEGSSQDYVYACKEWMPPSFQRYPSLYQIGSFGAYIDPVGNEPLNQRGWTLQERFLSPRIVHFTSRQVFVQCGREVMAEDGARFENVMSKWAVLKGLERDPAINAKFAPVANRYESSRRSGGWNFLVESYSRRQLSFETDKLPAIAGMARWLQQHTGETYLAGLWKEHICQDLLWRNYPYEEMRPVWADRSRGHVYGPEKPLSPFKKPKAYRAPSWSWASLDGSVKFEALSISVCSYFCDSFLEYYNESQFGKILSGWLKIKAPLVEVRRSSSLSKSFPETAVDIVLNGRIYQGHAYFDFEPELPCLAAMICKSNCLLLEKLQSEPDNFRRIGLAQLDRLVGLGVSMYEDDKVLAADLENLSDFTII
ncbi:heterokaryon incompatibility protein-domain-containing protein [Fusarium oxysporum]|nr:heterokaryon incompatibility protein-domain-containing protein [Fusarium oxysporum]